MGAVWARPLFPLTASLLPSSSSLTGLYLGKKIIIISSLSVQQQKSCSLPIVLPSWATRIQQHTGQRCSETHNGRVTKSVTNQKELLPYCVCFSPDASSPERVRLVVSRLSLFFGLQAILPDGLINRHVVREQVVPNVELQSVTNISRIQELRRLK